MGIQSEEVVDALIRIAVNTDEVSTTRLLAIQSLGQMGQLAEKAIPSLRQCLKDDHKTLRRRFRKFRGPGFDNEADDADYWLRETTVKALARIGVLDPECIELITGMAEITNRFLNTSSAVALWRLAPNLERFTTVSNYLSQGEFVFRCQTAYSLSQLGENALPFKTPLRTMLTDPAYRVRDAARFALTKIDASYVPAPDAISTSPQRK